MRGKRCHRCGAQVRIVLDGEEWCDICQRYQRPAAHGWHEALADREEA